MKPTIFDYFGLQRSIFGLCPKCGEIFRLSDCKVFLKEKPTLDWKDKLDSSIERLDAAEERLSAREQELRDRAREIGRVQALKAVARVDPVFRPKRLNPDDAKVLFHPIDFVVFDGMKTEDSISRIVLLDREAKDREQRPLQRSIERTIEKGNYEWQTLLVKEDGTIETL